jgi:hypothetical protein
MVIETASLRCFFCGRRFSPDLEMREGQFLHAWKVAVCLHCVTGNREGLPIKHPAIRQLAQRGINLSPLGNGMVPWPGIRDGSPPPGT